MVGLVGQQEPGGGEGLHQVHQLAGRCHRHRLEVGRDVAEDGEETLKQRLEPLVAAGDDL